MKVEVKQGFLEGISAKSVLNGKEYLSFLGIPYAKPPVGELRFQPPLPIEKWNGTLSAKKEGPRCIQKNFSAPVTGSEDCLYLNVYTPALPSENATPKAVMVYIHGGAFMAGDGSRETFSPDYLINHDIVLVTVNYRLHAFGFLNMRTKNSAGNCGLRDQNLAFKWVKENIKQFGGDPENITIFGESAGGTSVYLHLLSPMSKGLFHKAIIQSDPCYSNFDDEFYDAQNIGNELAKKLGCTEKDPEKVVEFLRKQPALEIYKNIPNMFNLDKKTVSKLEDDDIFRPSIEIDKENGFLPDTLENLKKIATPKPLIIGFNNKEGKLAFAVHGRNLIEKLKADFTLVVPHRSQLDPVKLRDISEKIKKHYLGDKPVDNETIESIVDIFMGFWFRKFYQQFDYIAESEIPAYVYEFCFTGRFNFFEPLFMTPTKSGACHSDELPYMFFPSMFFPERPSPEDFTEPELSVIRNTCTLWTNFAKYGNPTKNFNELEWSPYKSTKPCYLKIDKDLKLIQEKLLGKEFEFWINLLK